MTGKRSQQLPIKRPKPSRLFSPFRSIGNVSNDVPFAIGSLGSTFYIATATGRLFHIYDAATLHLLFVLSSQTPARISSIQAHRQYVYAAYSDEIAVYHRGKLIHTLQCHDTVHSFCVFANFLVAATCNGSIQVFKCDGKPYANIPHASLPSAFSPGQVSGFSHPPTYINKVAIALTDGIALLNVRTGKLVFRQQFAQGITCIESAPVLDVMALGSASGSVYLYHLKKGKVLHEINAGAGVVSLSFRSDGTPHLLTALANGDLFFYDLNKMKRLHVLRQAHAEEHGGVARAAFLAGQPILVSNGGDNTLKEYVFDPALSTSNSLVVSPPRLLRSRGGHSAPPTAIEFARHDKTHFVYLASRDRSFWTFSLRKDAQSLEISQRMPLKKDGKRAAGAVSLIREKFPAITAIASSLTREGEWANIVTCHADEPFARTWDALTGRVCLHQLFTTDNAPASLVCISQCGNFALVGSAGGLIASYNLQLGVRRKRYNLHKGRVTGLAIDGMNRVMVSAGLDGLLGFYDFSESTFLGKLALDAAITLLVYHKLSDLVVCALDDLSIVVVDAGAQKVVRVLYGHTNRITSLDVLPDGRWVVLASLDSTLRTWDIPSGGCIDGVMLPSVATNVRWSPLGDFLATTHVSGNGICLWTNRAQFGPVSTRHVDEADFALIAMPNVLGDGGGTMLDGALDDADEQEVPQVYTSKAQIESTLTLFNGPRSKYNQLLHCEEIKQLSKPKEPPKKPGHAPFFLSLSGEAVGDRASVAEGRIVTRENPQEAHVSKLHALLSRAEVSFESKFTSLLRQAGETRDFSEFLEYLVNLPPSTTDLEVRSLNAFAPLTEFSNFVNALTVCLASHQNFDIVTALFAMFMRCHGDVLLANPTDPVHHDIRNFQHKSLLINASMDSLLKYCLGVINLMIQA